ncbi:hypothetical protein DOA20_26135 [Salmonella enterica subsp. enterica serovar Newport]|nr:hypothetical protein [Salmonella enterica subsp. enterica serovar Newport]
MNTGPGCAVQLSPLAENIHMDALRLRLLALIKRTEDFFKNDSFMRTRLRGAYRPDRAAYTPLFADWCAFRDDCHAAPFSRFRLLYRLRIQSWKEVAEEQIVKLGAVSG